jgi:dipeptidyl aminopeptidase/acylaminoacyl peptidase
MRGVRREAAELGGDQFSVGSFRWSPDGEQIALVTAAGQKYSYYQNERIATMPSGGGKMTLRSERFDEDPGLLEWNAKGIWFTAAQKTERGLFVLDPATNAAKRLPVPNSLNVGAVSLRPNYRGSAGYGEKFRSLNVRNLGLGDYEDVIGGVDAKWIWNEAPPAAAEPGR